MGGQEGDIIEHRQAPQEGNGRTQGHQGIHIGSPVEQGLETAGVKVLVDVHDDNGQEHLGKHQSQMVPVQQSGHRPPQHVVAHGDVHEQEQEPQGGNQPPAEPGRLMVLQGFFIGGQLFRHSLFGLGGSFDGSPVACVLHGLDNIPIGGGPFHPHAVGQEGNRYPGDPGNPGHRLFHMGLARSTGHACYYILFHNRSSLSIPYQGILLSWSYHTLLGDICQEKKGGVKNSHPPVTGLLSLVTG